MESESKDVQIFRSLVSLVTSQEFSESQTAFFEKHQGSFTAEEENKLEYKEIYENYVYIVDEILDGNIKAQYSEEEVKAFYDGFKDRYPEYEKIHKATVDTLFNFVDFSKFKETMLEVKKAGNEPPKEETRDSIEMSQEYMDQLLKEDPKDPKTGWQANFTQAKEKNGFTCFSYSRSDPNNKMMMNRSCTVLKGIKLETFEKFLTDIKCMRQPEHKVLKFLDDANTTMYAVVKMPLMSDRESIFHIEKFDTPEGKRRFVLRSISHPDYPVKKSPVRMLFLKALECRQVGEDLEAHEFSQVNMGGYFPMRLLNMFIGSLIGKGMAEARKKMLELQNKES